MSTMRAEQTSAGWVQPVTCDGPNCTMEAHLPLGRPWLTTMDHGNPSGRDNRLDFCGTRCLVDWAIARTTAPEPS